MSSWPTSLSQWATRSVLHHPEAVMLAVEPVDELRALQRAIDNATSSVTGIPVDDDASNRWVPHITVGYGTGQPAEPIITALGTSIECSSRAASGGLARVIDLSSRAA